LVTAILFGFAFTSSVCPGDICNSTYSDKGAIIRVDDGDVFIPKYFINSTGNMTNSNMTNNCTNYNAYCISNSTEGCSACKCKLQSPTWRDDKNGCKNINNGYYVFDRSGLEVDTPVTTVYFVQNSNNNYELQSTETGTSLPLVRNSNGNDIRDSDGCSVYKLYIMTPGGFEQIDDNGFTLVETNQKYYIEISESQIKVRPEHFQGKLFELKLKCGNKKRSVYFKVQGKSTNIYPSCLDCEGNFKYLRNFGVPEFAMSSSMDDFMINPTNNTLQMDENDAQNCNEDRNQQYYYENDDSCSLTSINADNLLINSSQNNLFGKNLHDTQWNTLADKVINITVDCQGNQRFCILFRIINSSSHCSGNPCHNGGSWVPKGLSSCTCSCLDGTSGDLCSIITNQCALNPCCDGSTCTGDANSYQCSCPPGKTGDTCCTSIPIHVLVAPPVPATVTLNPISVPVHLVKQDQPVIPT
jgi:hypothetical protein